jgi:hypothetical protein
MATSYYNANVGQKNDTQNGLTLSVNDLEADVLQLNRIRETIETMSKFNQVEVLRILTQHKDVIVNENKYGIHINLSELRPQIIEELLVYIQYVNTQEIELNNIEKQKQDYKNNYFLKDNKDNTTNTINNKYAT